MIEIGRTPTKEEVESLLQNLWERAQGDAEEYIEMKEKSPHPEQRDLFKCGVAETHTYILEGIAQWAEINDIPINIDLEEWARKNLI